MEYGKSLGGFVIWLAVAAFWLPDAGLAEENGTGRVKEQVELEPMVVTAEKREGDAWKIPGGISVVGDGRIEDFRLNSVRDIVAVVPNFYVTDTGMTDQSFASMRGIGSSMTGTPTVGVYVDDVYAQPGLSASLADVERVEVLRGPQGTLYGRNSEAGVINIVTKKPGDIWEGKISADAGRFNSHAVQGVISGPLVRDRVSFRGGLRYDESDGWFENRFDGSDKAGRKKNYDGRFTVLATPGDTLDLQISYDMMRHDSPDYAHFALFDRGGDLRRNVDVDYAGETKKDRDTLSLRAGYDFGALRLVSITSTYKEDGRSRNDVDFTPVDLLNLSLRQKVSSLSQEFRLHSTDSSAPLQWLAGVFLLREKKEGGYGMWMNFMNMGMGMPGETLSADNEMTTTGGALFGEGTYTFADRLHLTLGLRYDRERQEFDYEQPSLGPALGMMGYGAMSGSRADTHEAWLPKASLSYDLTEGVMPYIGVSRGFRSGGYNTVDNLGSSFEPEFTWNYEAGLKTAWLDKRLQANLALFYIDWTDMQVEVLTAGGTAVYINNAAEASSRGLELELAARPVAGLDLFAAFAHTRARYEKYNVGSRIYDGNTIPDVPGYTASLGGTYRFGPGLFISLLYSRFGEVSIDVENTRSQKDYGLLNAKVGYEGDRFDFYLYGRNLLDEEYATRQVRSGGNWAGRAGEPLVAGANLSFRF